MTDDIIKHLTEELAIRQDEVELWQGRAITFMNEASTDRLKLKAAERKLLALTLNPQPTETTNDDAHADRTAGDAAGSPPEPIGELVSDPGNAPERAE